MLHFFWSLLNLGLIIGFVYITFTFIVKPKSVLTSKFKLGFMLFCLVGLVQSVIAETKSHRNTNAIAINQASEQKNTKIVKTTLEDHLMLDIHLHLLYDIENEAYLLSNSQSFLTGFVSGFKWDLKGIDPSQIPFEYTVEGTLAWHFFGFTVYTQNKTFTVDLKTLD